MAESAIKDIALTVRIRARFTELGPTPLAEFTQSCIDAGLFDGHRYHLLLRACEPIVQKALSHEDESGLPFAGPGAARTDEHKQIWKQRDLWSEADSSFNIQTRATQTIGDIKVIKRLNDEHERRWGYRIVLPDVSW
jgi:hypothetical protein